MEPATHGTRHLTLALVWHAVSTPADPHDASVLHAAHGSMPVAALNVAPLMHEALHTALVVATHSDLIP